jgi:glutaredoxin
VGKKLTKEIFVERSIEKHGDFYDYSKVVYVNAKTKVLIICPDHGGFWQTPANHLTGSGCPHCKIDKVKKSLTKTQEQVIKEFREVHRDWYDYSKVEYVNNRTKVLIICPDHGEFWQTPSSHLSGQGCPHCVGLAKLTKEEFVEKAIEKHGEWYDYSRVEYVNSQTKVLIICPDHGEFWQTPSSHLMGHGCPHCGGNAKLTKEEFVEKSILVHGDWYDYSKVEYINNETKVLIICPIHGEFWQRPHSHLSGNGCPHCKNSKLENSVENFLKEKNIFFTQKYREFDWLKNKLPLELDFYLLDYNIGIECQGKQHFESIEYWGGNEALKNIQERDGLKKFLCEKNGVKLFFINYDDNIEEKMNEILKIIL